MCEENCKRICPKHVSLTWTNWNSDWEQNGPNWAMSSLRKLFISGVDDCSIEQWSCFVHLLLQHFQYCNIRFNSGKFWGHSWGGIKSAVSFCNNTTLACVQWAFQVSQGSVETLFRWGGKRLIILKQICSGNGVPIKFYQNRQTFVGDITKNVLVSFFLDTVYSHFDLLNVLIIAKWEICIAVACTKKQKCRRDASPCPPWWIRLAASSGNAALITSFTSLISKTADFASLTLTPLS